MVLGLVGFERHVSGLVERNVVRQRHFCFVFDECSDLEAMIRDGVELPLFDSLILEASHVPRIVRFSLGFITSLRGELYRELCVVTGADDPEFWSPLEGEVDQWLDRFEQWRPRTEVVYLFPDDEDDLA